MKIVIWERQDFQPRGRNQRFQSGRGLGRDQDDQGAVAIGLVDVDAIYLAPVNGVGDLIQRVTDDPVARPYASGLERPDYEIGHSFRHAESPVACSLGAIRSRSPGKLLLVIVSELVPPYPRLGQTVWLGG